MDRITLENYRCFREKQSARLAPLTLLVGNNSTGKTSFLALIRALWDVANRQRVPDFKEDPYARHVATMDDSQSRAVPNNISGRIPLRKMEKTERMKELQSIFDASVATL